MSRDIGKVLWEIHGALTEIAKELRKIRTILQETTDEMEAMGLVDAHGASRTVPKEASP